MKNRRSFLKKMSAGALLAGILPWSAKAADSQVKLTGTLVHHVFFWLKDPNNPAVRKQFEKGISQLLKVETIRLSHVGVPASTEKRDVVDHSYTYSYLVFFDSKEEQEIYQQHPLHLQFIEECSPLWSKVVVYDSVDG
ncbi:MAG TPA: Dabb family protein [Prolixibacteraceae bacterium]|nr:Dabb family protein [Prolixibacteraceae bacterium]